MSLPIQYEAYMREHGTPIFEYNQITEQIYLGTTPCCSEHLRDEIFAEGIDSIISLEGENEKAPAGVEIFLWLPISDNTAPSMDQLRLGIRTIDELMRMERKVYVHCRYGKGRGPTLVAAHFIKHGMTVDEAISFVKKHRLVAAPVPAQIERLLEYEHYVREKAGSRSEPHRIFPPSPRELWRARKGPRI